MFSLIISIISIALVAALALATIYYGGDAFNKGSAQAKASQLINEGQQIAGAITLNQTDAAADGSVLATDVKGLAAGAGGVKYLQQVPEGWDGDVSLATGPLLTSATVSDKVCDAVNDRANVAKAATLTADYDAKVYGCYGDTANQNTVFYRF